MNIKIFYFIGRLNPPHNGHLMALRELIEHANSADSIPLILLGSGPNKGTPTMDNPISFGTKKAVTEALLQQTFGIDNTQYKIMQMENAARDVCQYICEIIDPKELTERDSVEIIHVAGGKDNDSKKLDFIVTSVQKMFNGKFSENHMPTLIHTNHTIPVAMTDDDETAMSATQVRKAAYRTVLEQPNITDEVLNLTYGAWPQIYKDFYGEYAQQIYKEIMFPLYEIPNRDECIQYYLDNGEIWKPPKNYTVKRSRSTLPPPPPKKTKTVNVPVEEEPSTNQRKSTRLRKGGATRKQRTTCRK